MTWLTGMLADYWLWIALIVVGIAALANPVAVWKLKAWILAAVIAWWGFTGHQAHDALQVAHAEHLKDDAVLQAELNAATARASEAARALEQAKAQRNAAIDAAYERGKTDAKRTGDAVAADLLAGNRELRDHWRGCETARVSEAATAPGGPDGGAALRAADTGRLAETGARADAQVIGLQRYVVEVCQ